MPISEFNTSTDKSWFFSQTPVWGERAASGKQELVEAAFSIGSMSSADLAAARVWMGERNLVD
ncbi:hypothetical protein [Cupriavidus sp. H39]|uniref:hypothetical protein n=1 Tax=Cupriavidus sp. H39 TaxID=3401635 RepID=UPI003D053B7C